MTDSKHNSKQALVEGLNGLLADYLALYLKTKNFHWHVAGPRFRDLDLMFDDQARQMLAVVGVVAHDHLEVRTLLAEHVRKQREHGIAPIITGYDDTDHSESLDSGFL